MRCRFLRILKAPLFLKACHLYKKFNPIYSGTSLKILHHRILRKYKLDELPQLFNVINGTMSLVGPRPEVRKYVSLYNEEQLKVLSIKPGITDYASLLYFSENEILGKSIHPEQSYINDIMPEKLRLNLFYVQKKSMFTDVKIILKTIYKIIK